MVLSELRKSAHLSASSIGDYVECGCLYRFEVVTQRYPSEL